MMTTVVFFLLLSTSFIEFTKITIPPSKVSTITAPERPPPAQPKLYVMKVKEGIRLQMNWSGEKPGASFRLHKIDPAAPPPPVDPAKGPQTPTDIAGPEIQKLAKELADEYHTKFPNEKTLQIGMASTAPYQFLVSTMDGVREAIPDMVIISHAEVDAETKRSGLGD
jgi:hypothetical protein